MRWTPKTEKALYKAAQLHEGLYRKGPDRLPALVHLVAVASLVSEYTDRDDVVVAALLHDSIEDTAYTPEALTNDFGATVAAYVQGVTIPGMSEGKSGHPFADDRRGYYENLKTAPLESVLISAADKLHNFESTIGDYANNPERFATDFRGTKESRMRFYGALVILITERLGTSHPLVARLTKAWEDYVAFIEDTL